MKALTTKINEYKRKIAKKQAAIAHYGEQHWRSDVKRMDIATLKTELCDLLLERVAALEAENESLSKEYEVGYPVRLKPRK